MKRFGLFGLVLVVSIFGAIKMRRLEARWVAIAGCVCAFIPWSVCFPLGIAAGLWGLWLLYRPEIALAFDVMAAARAAQAARSRSAVS